MSGSRAPGSRTSGSRRPSAHGAPGVGELGVREFAPAKINLYLHITGRRADGYHTLDSLMTFADIGDVVDVRNAPDLSLRIIGPHAAALRDGEDLQDNLVMRAARALRESGGAPTGAKLVLHKHLPIASGIGGGSADAAATLRALMRLWRLRPASRVVARLALGLGADVPACLGGRAVFAGGIGERLAAAPTLPRAAIILVNPGVTLATQAVFRARRGAFSSRQRFKRVPRDVRELAELLAERRNDLTEPALRLCPAIAEVLTMIERMQGCLLARMSGSGATCFGIFATTAEATRAAHRIRAARPQWWIKAGHLS